MTPAKLLALAQRLRDHAATFAPNATREDMLEAARYLRACAGAEPVATARQPMTEREIIGGFELLPEALTFFTAFEAGVRHAERHHRIDSPQPTSAQPTLTAEIVEAGTPNMFWDEDPDGDGYVGNTLQEIVEIACDDLTSADGHLYVDVGCARKLPTIAVRAWIDGEGALHWEEVPDTWPWGDE